MEPSTPTEITVQSTVNRNINDVWKMWNTPEDICNWCFASPEWHCPKASNDLRAGGVLSSRMEAKDGSFGFDFEGTYTSVVPNESLEYVLGDGRKVSVRFSDKGNSTEIVETFDAEGTNPVDMQRAGWQAILDNFKNYAESK